MMEKYQRFQRLHLALFVPFWKSSQNGRFLLKSSMRSSEIRTLTIPFEMILMVPLS